MSLLLEHRAEGLHCQRNLPAGFYNFRVGRCCRLVPMPGILELLSAHDRPSARGRCTRRLGIERRVQVNQVN